MHLASWYDPPTNAPSDFRQTNNTATNTKPTHVYHATYTNASEGLERKARAAAACRRASAHVCSTSRTRCLLLPLACGLWACPTETRGGMWGSEHVEVWRRVGLVPGHTAQIMAQMHTVMSEAWSGQGGTPRQCTALIARRIHA